MKSLVCYKHVWVGAFNEKMSIGRIIIGNDKREYKIDKLRYVDSIGAVWDTVRVKNKNATNR